MTYFYPESHDSAKYCLWENFLPGGIKWILCNKLKKKTIHSRCNVIIRLLAYLTILTGISAAFIGFIPESSTLSLLAWLHCVTGVSDCCPRNQRDVRTDMSKCRVSFRTVWLVKFDTRFSFKSRACHRGNISDLFSGIFGQLIGQQRWDNYECVYERLLICRYNVKTQMGIYW